MAFQRFFCLVLPAVLSSCSLFAQSSNSTSNIAPVPQVAKIAHALVGAWNNVETMEPDERWPHGAERRGASHCELGTGGTTLICQGSSDGSAGKLDHLVVIWWDKNAQLYGFFICYKDWGSGCESRGTAHWEGDVFVNDYTENINGKPTKMRDSFIDITPNSHTLIAAIETADGKMKTLITTRSTRR
jgi:hypothetical protein